MNSDVIIVGGGLAGLAAAVALAPRGYRVTILEARPRLGGRASSFTDPATGQLIDACQHVSMGCCTSFAELAKIIGISHFLEKQETLYFVTPDRRVSRFRRDPWPAPFHLGRALASAHYLNAMEKMRIAWGMAMLVRESSEADPPLLDWLMKHRQTPRCIQRFWSVVLTSALNESVENLGLKYARKVFVDGFLRDRDGFVVELPTVPLGRFYGEELRSWLAQHHVEVMENCAVRQLFPSPLGGEGLGVRGDSVIDSNSAQCGVAPLTPSPSPPRGEGSQKVLELRDGRILSASNIILAVPFDRVLDLLPSGIAADPFFAKIARLEPSPITSVHFWFDRDVLPYPHVVLVDCLGQWVFRRDGGYLQVVVSASQALKSLGRDEIERRILDELRSLFPVLMVAKLLRSKVVTERTATFRAIPGVDALRPSQLTPIPGLYLAGDYTQTGWPATMEGAVRSGFLAATVLASGAA